MFEDYYMTADDVAKALKISKSFAFAVMDKPVSYYAFEMLYWCGIREGELLALTAVDFDFERGTVTINKSYQRIDGRDVITEPKTPKSSLPKYLTSI